MTFPLNIAIGSSIGLDAGLVLTASLNKKHTLGGMQTIATASQLEHLKAGPALLVLFGGAHCGVCQVIKPRIESLMAQHFPEIVLAYVDCEERPGICAQHSVFTLPVVKLFVEGQVCLEMARRFSLQELVSQVDRIYRLWQDSKN